MKTFSVHEAKTHLSRLLAMVEQGEEIVVTKSGTPVATLSAYQAPKKKRIFGDMKGRFTIPDDFDKPMPEEWFDDPSEDMLVVKVLRRIARKLERA